MAVNRAGRRVAITKKAREDNPPGFRKIGCCVESLYPDPSVENSQGVPSCSLQGHAGRSPILLPFFKRFLRSWRMESRQRLHRCLTQHLTFTDHLCNFIVRLYGYPVKPGMLVRLPWETAMISHLSCCSTSWTFARSSSGLTGFAMKLIPSWRTPLVLMISWV